MSLDLRLAWRNLWRNPRRTWLTVGAMVFSNIILVFLISLQLGMYGMMINNSLRAQTGHLQVQAPGFLDGHKIRQVVADVVYRPGGTAWLTAVAARGARTVDGLGMLLHQGAAAFAQWTGREPPVAAMRAALGA